MKVERAGLGAGSCVAAVAAAAVSLCALVEGAGVSGGRMVAEAMGGTVGRGGTERVVLRPVVERLWEVARRLGGQGVGEGLCAVVEGGVTGKGEVEEAEGWRWGGGGREEGGWLGRVGGACLQCLDQPPPGE